MAERESGKSAAGGGETARGTPTICWNGKRGGGASCSFARARKINLPQLTFGLKLFKQIGALKKAFDGYALILRP